MAKKTRFVDSGWRLTIPKSIRAKLGWDKDTLVCVSWDGRKVHIRHPLQCKLCPDMSRLGALGKIVIPPKVRAEAQMYRGQILSFVTQGDEVIVQPDGPQVRCQACGWEMDVQQVLPNVYLCGRCRQALDSAARAVSSSNPAASLERIGV